MSLSISLIIHSGQREPKHRAAAKAVIYAHMAVVPFDDRFHHRQPQPKARLPVAARRLRGREALKQVNPLRGWNAGTLVANSDPYPIADCCDANSDLGIGGPVFACVEIPV